MTILQGRFSHCLTIGLALCLSACASTSGSVSYTNTSELIAAVAEAAPRTIEGEYVFEIQASGSQNQYVYLNTELDYRDQRCITLAISPETVSRMELLLGETPQQYFTGKTVRVHGAAERATIWLFSNGRRTEKYYYQTHIPINSPEQIEVIQ